METQRHQQKFLTLEFVGRSCISSTYAPLRERTLGYFLHLILLGPGGLLIVSVLLPLLMLPSRRKRARNNWVLGN